MGSYRQSGRDSFQLAGVFSCPGIAPEVSQIFVINLQAVTVWVVEVDARGKNVVAAAQNLHALRLKMVNHLLKLLEALHLPGQVVGADAGSVGLQRIVAHGADGQFMEVLPGAQEDRLAAAIDDVKSQGLRCRTSPTAPGL